MTSSSSATSIPRTWGLVLLDHDVSHALGHPCSICSQTQALIQFVVSHPESVSACQLHLSASPLGQLSEDRQCSIAVPAA